MEGQRIITVTLNPAIDLSVEVPRVQPEAKLRCTNPRRDPGGGGLNVSRAIAELGGRSLAVYPVGGHTGALLGELVGCCGDSGGLSHHPIEVAQPTRENVTVVETDTGRQFRLAMPGSPLTGEEVDRCLRTIAEVSAGTDGALVVLSGSMPPGFGPEELARAIAVVRDAGGRAIVDTSGPALRKAAGLAPLLMKPNALELGALLEGRAQGESSPDASDPQAVGRAAVALARASGVAMLLVSLGEHGAVLATADGYAHAKAPPVEVVSAVGAGDCMVAAAVLALARSAPPEEVLRDGVAAGSAALLTPGTELLRRGDFERLRDAQTAREPDAWEVVA